MQNAGPTTQQLNARAVTIGDSAMKQRNSCPIMYITADEASQLHADMNALEARQEGVRTFLSLLDAALPAAPTHP